MAKSKIGNVARQSRDTTRTLTKLGQPAGRGARRRRKPGRRRQAVGQVQQRADENRITVAALVVGVGLAVAARLLDSRRMDSRSAPTKRVVRPPLLLAIAAVTAAGTGIWLLRRIKGKARAMTGLDLLLAWLNDAYSMETSLVQTLQGHAKDAQEYPQIQARIEQHMAETRRHADLVKSCIERLGGSTSTRKRALGSVIGKVQGLGASPARDAVVKNALAEAAAESFEVASYTALVAAAHELGDQETATVCQQILREDEEMAQWLEQNLPMITREILNALTASTG